MRLLIIGDDSNQYVENFSKALLQFDNSVIIDIFPVNPDSGKKYSNKNNQWFRHIYSFQSLTGFTSKIPKLRGFLTMQRIDRVINNVNENINQYDVILLHGLWQLHCYIFSKLNKKNIFTIGAIWGSDFYKRVNNSPLFETMDECNLMVISTNQMVKDILKVKTINKDKIRNCLFGSASLQKLVELQNVTSKQSKKFLGFEENDFIIACGYNGSPNNQHLKILSVLNDIKTELPKQTKIILQITYGGSDEYKNKIKKAFAICGLDYVVYEKFLSDEEVAHLRKATDLMVQIPVTDAFSSSLREHLFAQNIVIAGSWLPYQSLKNSGIYFESIDDTSNLSSKLTFILRNASNVKEKVLKANTADKFKSSLWSECIKDWHSMLNEYRSYSHGS
ncbi:MAG: hypothetical protein ACTHML_17425 [Ginsengibacter sp.]